MENVMKNASNIILVLVWNRLIQKTGYGEKIHLNDAEFFKKFSTPYDAAWAVSIGDWRRTDEYVCFNEEGYLVSFNQWDDKNSPIDVVRLSTWLQTNDKNEKGYVDNISKTIHDALQEV